MSSDRQDKATAPDIRPDYGPPPEPGGETEEGVGDA